MRTVIGFTMGVTLAASTMAASLSWWTPKDKDCPSFTSEAACTAYCAQNPSKCGDSTACTEHTGPVAPGC